MLIQRFPGVVSVVTDCCETRETRGFYGMRAIVSECNARGWLGPACGRGQNSRHGAIAAAPTIHQPLRLPATRPVEQLARLPDTWPRLLPAGLAKRRSRPYL